MCVLPSVSLFDFSASLGFIRERKTKVRRRDPVTKFPLRPFTMMPASPFFSSAFSPLQACHSEQLCCLADQGRERERKRERERENGGRA